MALTTYGEKIANTLDGVIELFSDEFRWTQHGHFRLHPDDAEHCFSSDLNNNSDDQVESMKSLAGPTVCFCLEGAVYRCAANGLAATTTMRYLDKLTEGEGTVAWNDAPKRTVVEVREFVARARAAISPANS